MKKITPLAVLAVFCSTMFAQNEALHKLIQQKQFEDVIEKIPLSSSEDSTNTTILVQKGDIYMKQNNSDDAISAYYSALLYNPENAALANTVVNILHKLGEAVSYDWAIDICLESLGYNPTDKALRRTLGIGYYSTFKYEKADSVFTTLRAENDKNFITLKYAAASKLKQKLYALYTYATALRDKGASTTKQK